MVYGISQSVSQSISHVSSMTINYDLHYSPKIGDDLQKTFMCKKECGRGSVTGEGQHL